MEPAMSSIPNSAIPHAGPAAAEEGETQTLSRTEALSQRASDLKARATEQAGRLAGLVRDNPKTAIAAGAAVAAGVAAAAAVPIVRAARRKSANGSAAAAPKTAAPKAPARKRVPARKTAAKKTT
jgi:hypothetical protein